MNASKIRKAVTLGSGIFLGSWAISALAVTMPPPIHGTPVSNIILSRMIGRGVIGGRIVYFGIEMRTNWTSPAQNTPMQGNLNIVFNTTGKMFQPTITYSALNSDAPYQQAPSGTETSGAGLRNIQGIRQGIQISGNTNSIQNDMTLNVVNGAPSSSIPAGTTLLGGGVTHNGDITMTVSPNHLSMLLSNGANRIQQGIGSNGLFQSAQVQTDGNHIQNTLGMTLGVSPMQAGNQDLALLRSLVNEGRFNSIP